jgi:putative redox protein
VRITVDLVPTGPSTSQVTVRDHVVTVDRPASKGGADAGPMGGELLLASLAGCFASNLLAALATREATVEALRIRVEGSLTDAPSRFEAATLTVSGRTDDRDTFERTVLMADRACIVANTLRSAIKLTVAVQHGGDDEATTA